MRIKIKNKLAKVWVIVPVFTISLVLVALPGSSRAAMVVPDTGQHSYIQHSYTKLDENGNALSVSATVWYQVKDNVNGLIWEVKQDKDGIPDYSNPHDADNRYSWYNSCPVTNGGNAGTSGDGTDTEDFIAALNSENAGSGYCGHTDWRLPTVNELSWLANSGRDSQLKINTTYFPQTVSYYYWSSSTHVNYAYSAWRVYFFYGYTYGSDKAYRYNVRAVRSGYCSGD